MEDTCGENLHFSVVIVINGIIIGRSLTGIDTKQFQLRFYGQKTEVHRQLINPDVTREITRATALQICAIFWQPHAKVKDVTRASENMDIAFVGKLLVIRSGNPHYPECPWFDLEDSMSPHVNPYAERELVHEGPFLWLGTRNSQYVPFEFLK